VAGCAHQGGDPAARGPNWTPQLAEAGVGAPAESLAAPRSYSVAQIAGNVGEAPSADEGGYLLADIEGPGAVLRLWAENPVGIVTVYADNMDEPVLRAPLAKLFLSALPAFRDPVAGFAGGGCYAYAPIPFNNRCRIVLHGDGGAPPYQVTYAQFDEDQDVETFNIETMTGNDEDYFKDWSMDWAHGHRVRFHDLETEDIHYTRKDVYPHKNVLLRSINGPGVINEIEMEVSTFDATALQNMWIAIYWDDQEEPGVLAPLGGFFGSLQNADGNYTSPLIGQDGLRMWNRFPMPFRHGAQIRLINNTDAKIDLTYAITWREGGIGDSRYFHARYNEGQTREGRPYTVADLKGEGHYVGSVFAANGGESDWFLAGAEKVTVDGASHPQITGTSTGAYFNASWSLGEDTFSEPSHGVTVSSQGAEGPSVSAYRLHWADAIPFSKSLRFTLDHGLGNNQPGIDYASVAYWYQDGPADAAALWDVAGLDLLGRSGTPPEWSGIIARDRQKR
jgi:hypothetical protein